ncbi:GatB/YqeY domain-containing protein [Oenococcus alcoholitolerans]|uniref:GatB/YqeY domain-containing protein n=1 Tax=Oenococcus alcoholitolerans TaxID=931074 RepID=UPI003F71042E
MSLVKDIDKAVIAAMKEKDKESLKVLRMVKSALANKRIALGHDLSDTDALGILSSEIKSRQEAIEDFKKGNRQDLVDQNNSEIKIIQKFMPEPLAQEEVVKMVNDFIVKSGAKGLSDMGKVMGKLSVETKGRFDGGKLAKIVKDKLGA